MRWEYRDPPLVWLLVAAYALHIVEELVGGFPEWFAFLAGRPLPLAAFLIINGVALAIMAAAGHAATRHEPLGWMTIAIATVLLVNGLAHLLGSLAFSSYSPGLITGVVFYLPLAQLTLIRAWHQTAPPFFWRGVAAGLASHAVVVIVALASTSVQ